MVKVDIAGVTYNLPECWEDVNVRSFQELQRISTMDKNLLLTQVELLVIAAFTGCPIEDIMNISKEVFLEIKEVISFSDVNMVVGDAFIIDVAGVNFSVVKSLNKLTMGNTIDLENIIRDSTDIELLGNILPILIRKSVLDMDNGGLKPEDFMSDSYTSNRDLLLDNVSITNAMFVMNFF